MIGPWVAVAVAGGIASAAVLARWLTPAGALAATAVGAAVLMGSGWVGGAMLAAFFVSGSVLSRASERRGRARAGDPKVGARDATQVLANGAIAAAVALLASPLAIDPAVAAGGALAAAAADTWGTELGVGFGGAPRLITSLRPVPPGTSGGVTAVGMLASVAGAAAVAGAGTALGLPAAAVPVLVAAGVTGALLDSAAGVILQGVFRCDRCAMETERRVHHCGGRTRRLRGVPWITNDMVNLLATTWGAAVASVALPLSR